MRELRLFIDIFGLFAIQKGEEKPKYEEVTIQEKLKTLVTFDNQPPRVITTRPGRL